VFPASSSIKIAPISKPATGLPATLQEGKLRQFEAWARVTGQAANQRLARGDG
jgi:hypothetical protein